MAGNRNNNKATKYEKEARIEKAAKWIIQNPDAGTMEFCEWFGAQYDLKKRWAHEYRKWAFEALADEKYGENLEGTRRAAIASLKKMFKDCEDVKQKLAIRQELNKIQGLYTQKIEVEAKVDTPLYEVVLDTKEDKDVATDNLLQEDTEA